jgi:hypothetical protein
LQFAQNIGTHKYPQARTQTLHQESANLMMTRETRVRFVDDAEIFEFEKIESIYYKSLMYYDREDMKEFREEYREEVGEARLERISRRKTWMKERVKNLREEREAAAQEEKEQAENIALAIDSVQRKLDTLWIF